MNLSLARVDLDPLGYGGIMFLGVAVMWWKPVRGHWLRLTIDIGVSALVFKLNGRTMAGGFAAMVAALLAGLIFPMLLGMHTS